ncbi:DNA cytosine methyltransferase [Deinococcus sp. QL22]|uniref:DNA cytosine methyltransferase n=1 Tax=Deinococcus sp. QL22 TaxID=2939437 RepID=UPI002017CA02|nr:DNA cytosine methyltransferase [Deinococcus sp. QL22]UQN06510.1 DNA cytosine methyltransferase [Deinococcus sp. QL22]
MHLAGFKHLGLIEWDGYAASTLRRNSESVLGIDPARVIHDDARSVDYTAYAGKIDLLSGGPPCQPFSTGGANAGDLDPRNMFPVFLDAVKTVRPRAILMENVKGLMRVKFKDYFEYIQLRLQFPFARIDAAAPWEQQLVALREVKPSDFADDERYVLDVRLLDTADFGVPQRRERVIFMALRADLGLTPTPPAQTHSKLALFHDQWVTGEYWKRHGVRAHDQLTARDQTIRDALVGSLLPLDGLKPWRTVRDAISDLPPAVDRGEEPHIVNHVQHPGARIYPPCHLGSPPDLPAKALKAGTHGTPGGENLLHSAHDGVIRYFTTREAGRLQTFPDEWEFLGTWGACIKQLGNAVPVQLGQVYATAIRQQLLTLAPETALAVPR